MDFPTSSLAGSARSGSAHRIEMQRIIAQASIETHFQPIVSIKGQAIAGVEALARGIHEFDGRLILPATLFRLAAAENLTAELDAVCRRRAIENFAALYRRDPSLLLFLNFYTPALGASPFDDNLLSNQVCNTLEKHELPAHSVVLEVLESKFGDVAALQKLTAACRENQVLLALNGVGAPHSNLDRVTMVRPDLLKIDISLVAGLDQLEHRQEIFKALVQLARRSGALVVAEGIETAEQAMSALELGADWLQGYYFSLPQSLATLDFDAIERRIENVADRFKQHMLEKINQRKGRHRSYNVILNSILAELSRVSIEQFDASLAELIALYPAIQCAYVLDESGRQITDTICNTRFHQSAAQSRIYHPVPRGADHSLKEYFYLLLDVDLNKFTSEPYISLSTGQLCCTISTLFRDAHNNRLFVLCIDVGAEAARPARE